MKKIYMKLAASVLSIMIALTMIIGATYAWFTLSTSPEVNGINITIGGGRTILLAPDRTKTVDGVTVHYPGEFGSTLNISQDESYMYLSEAAGLSPVSTADGLYWLLPAYEEETGLLKEISEFTVDGTLSDKGGSYIYLDFWIVSPGEEFDIRVSTDTKTSTGSYLIELPKAEESEDGGFWMTETQGIMESIARVGFLVNTDTSAEAAMSAYRESENYIKEYENLRGVYQEKGQEMNTEHLDNYQYQFAIYEPNATKHPSEDINDGDYVITNPLSYNPYGNSIREEDVSGQLMVQNNNTWKALGTSTQLEQFFQSYMVNKTNMTAETATTGFYKEKVQGQYGSYVSSGNFYKRTDALYDHAENGVVSAEKVSTLMTAGATDDVTITKIAPNTPQRIRMYIWLEGQDADCTNTSSVESSSFALNLELAGANQ